MTGFVFSLLLVTAIILASAAVGPGGPWWWVLGAVIPYSAAATFLLGVAWRVIQWSRSPVPFRIPATCGQQKSLGWIKPSWLENPYSAAGVLARMALEVLLFRSLFRHNRMELREGPRLIIDEDKFLWLGALAFHWSFLLILLRHLRLFVEPVPAFVLGIEWIDGFFRVGTPVMYATDLAILAALLYLLQRRLRDPRIRYVSLFTDYFALFLLLAIAGSGVWMRYFARVDVVAAKQFALGLATFAPVRPLGLNAPFAVHLTLVSALAAYFPFSKLVHMAGVFLSPTRNLANNNRARRHVNPWDYPVKVHTYEEWETEFHDKIAAAGLPLERP